MALIDVIVVGSTGKPLTITFKNEDGTAKDLTGYAVRIQGKSKDIAKTIDVQGAIQSPTTAGVVKWVGWGGVVALSDLTTGNAAQIAATFKLRAKLIDGTSQPDWFPEWETIWVAPPL